ncbi:MAG TPA: cell division protein ZapD [Candidatus Berkiella sp.]|nr:cell division protein ZapD [Candidatus Berkiella sp.]
MAQQFLLFEHPLNERMRTFLRTEHLFQLAKYRLANIVSPWDARDCVTAIIELYNLIERTDFRGELLKEIERHTNGLQRLDMTPSVDHHALNKVLKELEYSIDTLRSYSAKQGLCPKESDLFNGIRQRLLIPGGTCSFDLPAFHYWLSLPPKTRQRTLNEWQELLTPLDKALSLVLDLTRQSCRPTREMAVAGTFQKSINAPAACQLIRIAVSAEYAAYPEISANKHRINVRFLQAQFEHGKAALWTQDIPFELTCCSI